MRTGIRLVVRARIASRSVTIGGVPLIFVEDELEIKLFWWV